MDEDEEEQEQEAGQEAGQEVTFEVVDQTQGAQQLPDSFVAVAAEAAEAEEWLLDMELVTERLRGRGHGATSAILGSWPGSWSPLLTLVLGNNAMIVTKVYG